MSDQPQTLPPLPFVCPLCLWSWASEEGLRAHIPASHNTTLDRFDAVMEDPTNAINYHVGVNERLTAEVERLTAQVSALREVLLETCATVPGDRDHPCWCEAGLLNHLDDCMRRRTALAAAGGDGQG